MQTNYCMKKWKNALILLAIIAVALSSGLGLYMFGLYTSTPEEVHTFQKSSATDVKWTLHSPLLGVVKDVTIDSYMWEYRLLILKKTNGEMIFISGDYTLEQE